MIAASLRTYRYFILGAALLGALAGFAIASLKEPTFVSSSTLLARHAGTAVPSAVTSTARALVANQQVAARAIEELKLGGPPLNLTPETLVKGHMRVDDVPGTFLIRVFVELPDRDLAAAVANAVTRQAIALNDSLNATAGKGVDGVLQAELSAARNRMIEAEQRLAAIRETARRRSGSHAVDATEQVEAQAHAEYDLARRLYDEVAVQYGKLRLQIAEKTLDLAVVEPAYPATAPVSGSRAMLAVFGGVTTLTLAVVVVGVFALVLAPSRLP